MLAPKPGQPPLKLEKRVLDLKVFEIDCSSILAEKDSIFGSPEVHQESEEIEVVEAKSKEGRYLKFKVSGGDSNIQYKDYLINFIVSTSNGSKLAVPVSLRCYSL